MMSHIFDSCPLTKLDISLHIADKALADVIWHLEAYDNIVFIPVQRQPVWAYAVS